MPVWLSVTTVTLASLLATLTAGNESCGEHAIPFQITLDTNGHPELYCNTPACFGQAEDTSSIVKPKFRVKDAPTQTAQCSDWSETVCAGKTQWTGGLRETSNGTHRTLKTECCNYDGLFYARELEQVNLKPGDKFTGGEVYRNGRLVSFDLIKEVSKLVRRDNSIRFIVRVFRMNCIAAPTEPRNEVDPEVSIENLSAEFDEKKNTVNDEEPPPEQQGRRRPPKSKRHQKRRRIAPADYEADYPDQGGRIRGDARRGNRRGQNGHPLVYEDSIDDRPYARPNGPAKPGKKGDDNGLWPVVYAIKSEQLNRALANSYEQTDDDNTAGAQSDSEYIVIDGPKNLKKPTTGRPRSSEDSAEGTATVWTSTGPPAEDRGGGNLRVSPPVDSYQSTNNQILPPAPPAPEINNNYAAPPTVPQGPVVVHQVPSYAVAAPLPPQQPPQQQQHHQYVPDLSSRQIMQAVQQATQYQAASPSYTPTEQCCDMGDMQCFSGDMTVQTPAGTKSIRDLQLGDMVLSIEESLISYSPIVMFLHKLPDESAVYRRITVSGGAEIKMTDNHLIYATNCRPGEVMRLHHARDVRPGQCVFLSMQSAAGTGLRSARITNITQIHERGIYAPLTASGDIIVNRVLASCHSNVLVQTLQQTFFSWMRAIRTWLGYGGWSTVLIPNSQLPIGIESIMAVMDLLVPSVM